MRDLFFVLSVLWLQSAGAVVYPAAGSFYDGAGGSGGSATTCHVASCAYSSCGAGTKLSGCGSAISGNCIDCANTLAAGFKYSAYAPSDAGVCPSVACTACPTGEVKSGCGASLSGTSDGSCTGCTGLGATKYWGPNTGATSNCPQLNRKVCGAGEYTVGSSTIAEGTCSACSGLGANKYWTTPTSWDHGCIQADKTKCNAGEVNSLTTSPSFTSAGTCSACPALTNNGYYYAANTDPTTTCLLAKTACSDSACVFGEYIKDCGAVAPWTSSGTCSACNKAAPNQVYNSKGGWDNNCGVKDCPTSNCQLGQYVTNCGAKETALGCAACTNAIAGTSFYPSVGISPTCTTQNCKPCDNGKYSLSCTTVLDGTCDGSCTN